jgi:uncharacterized membrane protein
MGQLESLREPSIAQPTQKNNFKKKKQKQKNIYTNNNNNNNLHILPWLFHLIGIPMIFEVLILRLK